MWRSLIPAGLFIVLVAFLAKGLFLDPREVPSPLVGKPAPAFSLPSLADPTRQVSLSDFSGQVFLFNVWGSWCVACRQEHDALLAIQASGEVPIVGLNWKDGKSDAENWLRVLGNPYSVNAVDYEGRTAIDYGVYGAPETFLIDGKGMILYKQIGPITWNDWTQVLLPKIRSAKEAK